MDLARLSRPSPLVSRSITAENPGGMPGAGGRATTGAAAVESALLGQGWKVSPCIRLEPGATTTIARITGPGVIQHLWFAIDVAFWRSIVLRIRWDGAEHPAVEVPLGDFFCNGWAVFSQVSSLPVAVNPHGGLNSYWSMPFLESATITVENLAQRATNLYYQVDYGLGAQPTDSMYLHARWRRSNPVDEGVHTIVDGIEGRGTYVGTYLAWQSNSRGWWGEGEVKFFLDGDDEFPTICGTGTEDYFGGAWDFNVRGTGYTEYTTPFQGLNQVIRPDGVYDSQQRFGMYRWHIPDPIAFTEGIRATVQALGQGPGAAPDAGIRYRTLRDDVASTAFLYLATPAGEVRPAPTWEQLEVA